MTPFQLLADPVRYRIVEILASGRHTAGELADAVGGDLGISRSAVSHHLRILRDRSWVRVQVEGPVRQYRLDPAALEQLDEAVEHLRALWDRRIGWPYRTDPLAPPARPHRATERMPRGRRRFDLDDVEIGDADDPFAGLLD